MEKATIKLGDLARVIRGGSWFGAFVRVTEKDRGFCQVQCCGQALITFFSEDELRKIETMPCPKCLAVGIIPPWDLSKPQKTSRGLLQTCAIHGELFLWDQKVSRKKTHCDICGAALEDSIGAMIRHKIATGHRLYSQL